jgi:hypothetical protein
MQRVPKTVRGIASNFGIFRRKSSIRQSLAPSARLLWVPLSTRFVLVSTKLRFLASEVYVQFCLDRPKFKLAFGLIAAIRELSRAPLVLQPAAS